MYSATAVVQYPIFNTCYLRGDGLESGKTKEMFYFGRYKSNPINKPVKKITKNRTEMRLSKASLWIDGLHSRTRTIIIVP